MGNGNELDQIKQMLSTGHLTLPDPSTGYHRSLYSRCPKDGHDSSIHRTERSGEAIIRVIFRCSICGKQFDAAPESMFLR